MCIRSWAFPLCTQTDKQACLKKTEEQLELLADANVLLMVEKVITVGIHCVMIWIWNDPSEDLSCLVHRDADNLYGWENITKIACRWLKVEKEET